MKSPGISQINTPISSQKNQVKSESLQFPKNFQKYLLHDYGFLNEYQLLDSPINGELEFLAKIKDTQQFVKFVKRQFLPVSTVKGLSMYKRFEAMFALFQKGIILADNIFILEQGKHRFYYYVIQPYLVTKNNDNQSTFITLQQYLYENKDLIVSFQTKKALFQKCKTLFDNLSTVHQAYCGLNSKQIIIDDQGRLFLLPFRLQLTLINKPYERSYYSKQILDILKQNSHKQALKCMNKWDIWSFGCISIQIFLYLTPYFLSTSLEKQINRITNKTFTIFQDFSKTFIQSLQDEIQSSNSHQQISLEQHLINQRQECKKVLNFLMNAFNSDQSQRCISFQFQDNKDQKLMLKSSSIKYKSLQSVKRMIERKKGQFQANKNNFNDKAKQNRRQNSSKLNSDQLKQTKLQNKSQFKQLNVCQIEKKHNLKILEHTQNELYSLQIKFVQFIIEDLQILTRNQNAPKQVKILINFCNGQKFQFCIDLVKENNKQDQENKSILVNKKITFTDVPIHFLDNLLQDDIQIQISENNFNVDKATISSSIYVNFSVLIIKNDKKQRIWKKPIKGTYQTDRADKLKCKIKIQANLVGGNQNQQANSGQDQAALGASAVKIPAKISAVQKDPMNQNNQFQGIKCQNEMNKSVLVLKQQNYHSLAQELIIRQPNSRKSSISKFSSINSQLQEISNYWKNKIEETDDVKQKGPDIQKQKSFGNRANISRKQFKQNELRSLNLKSNHKSEQRMPCVDLSRKLKNLLIR